MPERKEHNNPQRVFKEQDDLVVENRPLPYERDKLTSIRRSQLTSIAPDDVNWNNIYAGKQHDVHSGKPAPDSDNQ
jgi:hypothetical protein